MTGKYQNTSKGRIQMKSQKMNKNTALASAALLGLALMPTIAAAQNLSAVQSNGPLHLGGYGSFFIQGTPVLLTGIESGRTPPVPGNRIINQMYVQFMKPLRGGEDQVGDHEGRNEN